MLAVLAIFNVRKALMVYWEDKKALVLALNLVLLIVLVVITMRMTIRMFTALNLKFHGMTGLELD